ncbi:MAG TPA: hypothetical protein VFH29_01695, partial [Anaerolineales bacterium]|nr:hypothetical protein [Anaerolineales bacterium]
GASLRRLLGDFWAQSASVQNIVTPLSLIIIAGAFFGAQRSPPVHGFVWDFLPPSADGALRYLAFCMLEFGAVGILLLIQKPHRGMVALAMGVLLLLPLYRYGTDSVFSGRASIPALLVLCIVSIRAVFTPPTSPRSSEFARSLLIAALLVGCITPLHEIGRSTSAIVNSGGMPPPTDRWITFNGRRSRPPPDMGQLVAPQADTTFFFRILAREN